MLHGHLHLVYTEIRNTINKTYNSFVSSTKQHTIFQKDLKKFKFYNFSKDVIIYFNGIIHYQIYKGEQPLIFITAVTSIKKFGLKASKVFGNSVELKYLSESLQSHNGRLSKSAVTCGR